MKKRTKKHRVKDPEIMEEKKEKFEYLLSDVISEEELKKLRLWREGSGR